MDGQSIETATNEYYDNLPDWADVPEKVTAAQDKIRPSLLPMDALTDVVRVLTVNAQKHGDRTWETCDPELYTDAAWRHILAIGRGETVDEEGTNHWTAIACNALIRLQQEINKK